MDKLFTGPEINVVIQLKEFYERRIKRLENEVDEQFVFMFDIEKMLKYLKIFKGELLELKITDSNIMLKCDKDKARIAKAIEHRNYNAILKIKSFVPLNPTLKPINPVSVCVSFFVASATLTQTYLMPHCK